MEPISDLNQRLEHLELGHTELKDQMAINTQLTQQVKEDTQAIVAFFKNMSGFIQIVNTAGLIVKWVAIVGAATSALWYAVTHQGKFPGA